MNVILIDFTSDVAKFGYYNSDTKQFYKIENHRNRESDCLISTFQELLQINELKVKDINVIVCVTGPGSFTGIRMVLSFINGIVSGLKLQNTDIKIIPLTLFQVYLLSNNKQLKETESTVIIPSNKIGTVFVQSFNNQTYNSISPAKEVDINTKYENINIINGNGQYNIQEILKYVSNNLSKLTTDIHIIPCYIRPHYGIPKEYIVTNEIQKSLKKIIISNEEKQIGYIEYQTSTNMAEITDFQIEYEYRGIGAGKFLLNKFISKMKKQNFEKIILDVRSKNIIAQSLYKKFGFKTDGSRKNYYSSNGSDDAILMSLML